MKHFIKYISVFSLGFLILNTLLLFIPYGPRTNKEIFIEIKKDSLFKNIDSPRIIFIGGSNIAMGLNSQIIKDSLKLNPINTGIIATIGLKYMLRSSIEFIREGDIIIVIPEYHQFYQNLADGEGVLLPLLFEVSHKFDIIDIKQYIKLSQFIPKYIGSKLKFWKLLENDLYGLPLNNIYGDDYSNWALLKPNTFTKYSFNGNLNIEAFNMLTEFKTKVENKKAYLFISYPCYAESSFNECFNQINIVENKFKELQIAILGTPMRYKFNDSLIFDTEYHLTYDGVELRTKLFIEDFKKARTNNILYK